MKIPAKLIAFLKVMLLVVLVSSCLGASSVPPKNQLERVRVYTRNIEFDYVQWILDALWMKANQWALGGSTYINPEESHQMIAQYLLLVSDIQQLNAQIYDIYANPDISNPRQVSADLRQALALQTARRKQLQPYAEDILQGQIAAVAAQMGLTLGGQPVPPVLFHSTPLPLALIISPRNVIRQEYDISLVPDLTVDFEDQLETVVDRTQDVSSLVVDVGGVGVYPTMVEQTSSLDRLSEVVAHEWVHNFLTLRPLGASYMNSPQLRIMNETTASIAGKEIGRSVLERFYPELVTSNGGQTPDAPLLPSTSQSTPVFDVNKELHTTRITADKLLAEGKIQEAEAYMEQRRVFLWEHGYHIRKLNQAYFAFYGAYADQPGGAAGVDPVGTAVRELRQQSPTLSAFLNRISWMWSFEQLQRAVNSENPAKSSLQRP